MTWALWWPRCHHPSLHLLPVSCFFPSCFHPRFRDNGLTVPPALHTLPHIHVLALNSSFCSNVPPLKLFPSLTAVATMTSSFPGPASYLVFFKALTLHNCIIYLLTNLFIVCLSSWNVSSKEKDVLFLTQSQHLVMSGIQLVYNK